MIDNILKVLRGRVNRKHVKRNDDSPPVVWDELIRQTVSALFAKLEDIALQIEKTPNILTDIEKLKIELSWVLEEIANIEGTLDTLIDYTDHSKIDELVALPNSKPAEDYLNFLYFIRHDIVGQLSLVRCFFMDIDLFINNPALFLWEIKRTQMVTKRVRILISSLNNGDFDLYSLMKYIKSNERE